MLLLSLTTQTKGTVKSSRQTVIPAAVGLPKQRWDWDYGRISASCILVSRRLMATRAQSSTTYLQTDGQVHSTSKGSADGSRVQAQVFKEFGEGLGEGYPGPLLSDHHTRPHARQVKSTGLRKEMEINL